MGTSSDAPHKDIAEARQTYEGFTSLLKTATIIAAAVTAFVVLLIAS